MPILAYCLIEAQSIQAPAKGVGELPVESMEQDGLQCFFSQTPGSDRILALPTKQAALAFHNVVHAIFQQSAVIAFRFPTILEGASQLLAYLFAQDAMYRDALARLRNVVQMEIQLSSSGPNAVERSANESAAVKTTGTRYLMDRQAAQRALGESAAVLHGLGSDLVRDWRERFSSRGLRCFALIGREVVDDFKSRMAVAQLGAGVLARVSGPWPAGEFVDTSNGR
jgi:gas vesicle protein GvpL/GvpF